MKTITVCSSAAFYGQAVEIQTQLEKAGYRVIVPATALLMKEAGDYTVENHKTWLADPNEYDKKSAKMRAHFEEVEKSDAILVLNYKKHGVLNYIGGNVLMEMGLAFYLKKPIYIFNEVPEESAFLEEIIGLNPIALHGELNELIKQA